MITCTSANTGYYYPPSYLSGYISDIINISWKAPISGHFPLNYYYLFRQENTGSFVLIYNSINTGVLQYTEINSGINLGSTYTYHLQSIGNSGNSSNSCDISISVPNTPSAPTNLYADGSSGVVDLNWDPEPSNEDWDIISIERSDDGTNWTEIASIPYSSLGDSKYIDSAVTDFNYYYYRIRSHILFNNTYSNYSNVVYVHVT